MTNADQSDLEAAKVIARRLRTIALDVTREVDSGEDRNIVNAIDESQKLHRDACAIISQYDRGSDFYKRAGDPSTIDRYKKLCSDLEGGKPAWTVDTVKLRADTLRFALDTNGLEANQPSETQQT